LSGKRDIPPEAELFREAVRDVKPLPPRVRARAPVAGRKPPPRARFTAADRAMVLVESLAAPGPGEITDTGDEISFRRPGVQDGVLRKLKRGEYRVEEVCDLHGLRVDEAKQVLREFLAEALAHRLRCVRIIHGKGMGSGPRGPVLKNAVNMILRKTAPVLAFTSARRIDGGTGAINVLISV
jgi:DNA-nicking Smr family endonuclease